MDVITQNMIKIVIGFMGMIICAAMIYRMYKVEGLSEYARLDFIIKWRKNSQLNKLKKLQRKLNYSTENFVSGFSYSMSQNISKPSSEEVNGASSYKEAEAEDTELLDSVLPEETELLGYAAAEDTELLQPEDSKNKRRKGSLTVEAALVVPFFMFAILTIAYLMNLVLLHEIVQSSINETANEIGEYSYVYTGSGLEAIVNSLANSTEIGAQQIEKQQEAIANAYETLGKFGDMTPEEQQGTISSAVDKGIELGKSIKNSTKDQIKEKAKTIAKQEGVGLICYLGVILCENYGPKVNDYVTSAVAYAFVENQIASGNMSADEKLKSFGVVDGIEGLDFSGSTMLTGDKGKDIDIQVTYEVKLPVPMNIVPPFTIRQNAYVKGWNYGKDNAR